MMPDRKHRSIQDIVQLLKAVTGLLTAITALYLALSSDGAGVSVYKDRLTTKIWTLWSAPHRFPVNHLQHQTMSPDICKDK